MANKELLIELKELVDQTSLSRVLRSLAQICRSKAKHINTNWRNNQPAKKWKFVAAENGSVENEAFIKRM